MAWFVWPVWGYSLPATLVSWIWVVVVPKVLFGLVWKPAFRRCLIKARFGWPVWGCFPATFLWKVPAPDHEAAAAGEDGALLAAFELSGLPVTGLWRPEVLLRS